MKTHYWHILLLLLFTNCVSADTPTDILIVEDFYTQHHQPGMIDAALYLLETPYAAGTLEINEEEELTVNLREMDCTTFVETCLALTRSAADPASSNYEGFQDELRQIRYREGQIEDYTSRLHYITDWIVDNETMGIVEDITCRAGGVSFLPELNFMSTHPASYPALKGQPALVKKMREIEENINDNYDTACYIPCRMINQASESIHDGDMIFFTTSIAGLDVQHAAIAYWENKRLRFIHASSKAGKVIIDPLSIADYCAKQKTITGILIVRTV